MHRRLCKYAEISIRVEAVDPHSNTIPAGALASAWGRAATMLVGLYAYSLRTTKRT